LNYIRNCYFTSLFQVIIPHIERSKDDSSFSNIYAQRGHSLHDCFESNFYIEPEAGLTLSLVKQRGCPVSYRTAQTSVTPTHIRCHAHDIRPTK